MVIAGVWQGPMRDSSQIPALDGRWNVKDCTAAVAVALATGSTVVDAAVVVVVAAAAAAVSGKFLVGFAMVKAECHC